MRRRNNHRKMNLSFEDDQDYELEEDSLNQDYVQQKRVNKKVQRGPRGQQKRPKRAPEQSEDSINQSEEIIEFKHNDGQMKQHYRPSFIQRWNGIDNQIQIYSSQFKEMSPMFKIYWQTKCKHMNAIVFLQFGKMEFFAFQNDAILLHQMFKKKLKHFSSFLMVNFWYKQIVLIKQQLFDKGIPVLMMNEINDPQYRLKHNLIRRQVDEVITPGIHLNMEDKAYKQRWFMAFYVDDVKQISSRKYRSLEQQNKKEEQQEKLVKSCVVLLDSQSNKFFIEQFSIDQKLHDVRRVINRYRPVQLLLTKGSSQYIKTIKQMARQICNPYIIQIGYQRQQQKVNQTLQKFKRHSDSYLFKQLLSLSISKKQYGRKFQMFTTVRCLDLVYEYLETLKLREKIFDQGLFQISCFNQVKLKPFFDSQVYQNLQIFRIKNEDQGEGKNGTLVAYLDICMTNSGKKLLRKWLNEPLVTVQAIKQRQQCIRQIVEHDKFSQIITFHQKLIAYEKLQKQVADVYHWVIRGQNRKFLKLTGQLTFQKGYDQKKNPAIGRIKQILKILNRLRQFQQFLKQFHPYDLKSKYFQKITQITAISEKQTQKIKRGQQKLQNIPQLTKLISLIVDKIDYNESTDFLQPAQGVCKLYDQQKNEKMIIESRLEEELQRWKKHFKNSKITFTHVRARNQIQIPKTCFKSRKELPKQLIFSSQTATMERFTTAKTIQLSDELIVHQQKISQAYEPFMNEIVDDFCQYKYIWNKYVEAISQIDVVLSIAKTSKRMNPRCLPKFLLDDQKSVLNIKNAVHPGLVQVLEPENLICNSLSIKEKERFVLLTGPNMGGKSTLLRQTCLLSILAQIGSYVPCESYNSIVYDQIFCRIGSSDRIIQGKSTFYVQLQETNRILKQATSSSLVIIDELGRGTSTYDGMAIAESTIKYILENIGCYTLFSTHYTPITKGFLSNDQVKCCKMSYKLIQKEINNQKVDRLNRSISKSNRKSNNGQTYRHSQSKSKKYKEQTLQFLYQIEAGIAQKSFANNVAKMVGLSSSILQQANRKANWISQLHEQSQNRWRKVKNINQLIQKGVILQKKEISPKGKQ